jgi:hypothetical protein
MILIHRGKGAIVVIVGSIFAALIMNAVARGLFGPRHYAEHVWPKFGALWLAGLFCLAAGTYLRKYGPHVGDDDWAEREFADHFFFIPVLYWAPIFFVLGIGYLIYSFYPGT